MEEIKYLPDFLYAISAGTIVSLAISYAIDRMQTLSFETHKFREQRKIELANPRQSRSCDESGGIEDFF